MVPGRAEVQRVLPALAALAGLGFDEGNVTAGGEVGEDVLGAGVEDAATGDDHRVLRRADRLDHLRNLHRVGLGAADAPDVRLEEALGVVEGLGLDVLAEGEADRAAVRRVGKRAHGAGKCGEEMFGAGEAIKVAGDRAEAVVGRDGAVVEVLDLLQHWVGTAVGEDVAGDEENRQAVDVRQCRRGHHVCGAGADRGGHRLRPAAAVGLGVGNSGVRHRLLVLAAPGWKRGADPVQRLADAGDVAVAEDRPYALDEALAVLGHLHAEPPHHRLRCGQADRPAHLAPSKCLLVFGLLPPLPPWRKPGRIGIVGADEEDHRATRAGTLPGSRPEPRECGRESAPRSPGFS